MGEIGFTAFQQVVFDEFSKNKELRDNFYFGGGTALSVFYLHHRYSDDLDFFSEKEFDKDLVIKFINDLSSQIKAEVKMTKKNMVMWFELQKGKEILKVDFLNFPYKRVDKGNIYQSVNIDSPLDIGTNKLLLLNLNQEAKDYVDLYFLLKDKFTIWDLINSTAIKYKLELDLISLGADFMNAEKLEFLPRMIKPLTLDKLKKFYKEMALQIGKKIK